MANWAKWLVSICLSIVIILVQIIVVQWAWINHLKQNVEIVNQSNQIEKGLIQDLIIQLSNAKNDNSTIGSQQFVAGIMAAIQNPNHYAEIWHHGYDRGSNVARDEKESAYTIGTPLGGP